MHLYTETTFYHSGSSCHVHGRSINDVSKSSLVLVISGENPLSAISPERKAYHVWGEISTAYQVKCDVLKPKPKPYVFVLPPFRRDRLSLVSLAELPFVLPAATRFVRRTSSDTLMLSCSE